MEQIQRNFCLMLQDDLSDSARPEIESMSPMQWRIIYGIGCDNHLLPLMYSKIKTHQIAIPEDLKVVLRNEYLSCSGNDLRRKAQLHEVVGILHNHGIDHILLKGSHLAEKVYANSVLRPMCDIDVLIKKSDLRQACALLQTAGYLSSKSAYCDSELNSNKHIPPLLKAGGLAVELHWHVGAQYPVSNLESLWGRAQTIKIDGLETKVLSPEDLLLHISIHKGCDDKFISSLLALHDIKAVCAAEIDWDRLFALATSSREWGNTKCLFTTIYLCNKLLDAGLPELFLEKIKPADFNDRQENRLIGQFFSRIDADASTYAAVNALNTLSHRFHPRLVGTYFMSPQKICLRYNRKYSWRILPGLYGKRVAEKAVSIGQTLAAMLTGQEIKKLYQISKSSAEIGEWLKK